MTDNRIKRIAIVILTACILLAAVFAVMLTAQPPKTAEAAVQGDPGYKIFLRGSEGNALSGSTYVYGSGYSNGTAESFGRNYFYYDTNYMEPNGSYHYSYTDKGHASITEYPQSNPLYAGDTINIQWLGDGMDAAGGPQFPYTLHYNYDFSTGQDGSLIRIECVKGNEKITSFTINVIQMDRKEAVKFT